MRTTTFERRSARLSRVTRHDRHVFIDEYANDGQLRFFHPKSFALVFFKDFFIFV
jgi:hypothetical protein